MNSNKHNNLRGVKRKLLTDKEEEDKFKTIKAKFKEQIELTETKLSNEDDLLILDISNNLNNNSNDTFHNNNYLRLNEDDLSIANDLNDKENNEIDFLKQQEEQPIEFANNVSDLLNSNYLAEENKSELVNQLENQLDNELKDGNQINESFNTFLNTSLSNCYANSRPLTPLPQLDNSLIEQQQTPQHLDQRNSNANNHSQQQQQTTVAAQCQTQPQSSSSQKENQATATNFLPLNNFPALISHTKLFNSTSSSLFNAAAIVDTYFFI